MTLGNPEMTAETISAGLPAELLGDAHPLLERLGAVEPSALATASAVSVSFQQVRDLASLRRFLTGYCGQILVPIELPAIARARQHAAVGELRELVALDQQLVREEAIRIFAQASYRVGQRQLSKLRPLRDQRVVQRYLAAIEAGQACGWHTLVYGVSLAMFSLPLRQGLQGYSEQTLRGFVGSAARSLKLSEAECDALLDEHFSRIPPAIESVLLGLPGLGRAASGPLLGVGG